MAGRHRISCARFTCCGSIGGTLGWRVLRRRGGCWTRLVWRKVGNGRGKLCGRRLARRVTGARKHCPKDCVIWRRGRWRIGRRRDWSGTIGSCGGVSSWRRCGQNTTCWRCCKSRGCSTKLPKTKRYHGTGFSFGTFRLVRDYNQALRRKPAYGYKFARPKSPGGGAVVRDADRSAGIPRRCAASRLRPGLEPSWSPHCGRGHCRTPRRG